MAKPDNDGHKRNAGVWILVSFGLIVLLTYDLVTDNEVPSLAAAALQYLLLGGNVFVLIASLRRYLSK